MGDNKKSVFDRMDEQEEKIEKLLKYVSYEENRIKEIEKIKETNERTKKENERFEEFVKKSKVKVRKNDSIKKFKTIKTIMILLFIIIFSLIISSNILVYKYFKFLSFIEIPFFLYLVLIFLYVLTLKYYMNSKNLCTYSIYRGGSKGRYTPATINVSNLKFTYRGFLRLSFIFLFIDLAIKIYLLLAYKDVLMLIFSITKIILFILIIILNKELFSKYNLFYFEGYYLDENKKVKIIKYYFNDDFMYEETFLNKYPKGYIENKKV